MQIEESERRSKIRAEDRSVTVSIVEAVAERENQDPLDLPALADVVDAGALDRLVESCSDSGVTVSFSYAGYQITVSGDGAIRIDG
jgi:hypothetical protein